jgi:hypothetical protein
MFVTVRQSSVILDRLATIFNTRDRTSMWPGLDPELLRQLATIRQLVALSHRTPTREWPLVLVKHNALLVVREWPDGSITAYITSDRSDRFRNKGKGK